jgi:hypothetical protein
MVQVSKIEVCYDTKLNEAAMSRLDLQTTQPLIRQVRWALPHWTQVLPLAYVEFTFPVAIAYAFML